MLWARSCDSTTYLPGSHHHTRTNSVERVGGKTNSRGDGPAKEKRSKEVFLEGTSEDKGLDDVHYAEPETTVENDTNAVSYTHLTLPTIYSV